MPAKRVKITAYQRDYFEEGSAPMRSTVIRWIKTGKVVGEQIGRTWYVYPDLKPTLDQEFADVFAKFDEEALNYGNGQT